MIRRRLAVLFLLLSLALALEAQEPSLEVDADGRLILHSLPPVLEDEEVRPHLTKGLTTTFLFHVEPKGLRLKKKEQGRARIEIRYELWDEVFHVALGTADGQVERRTLDSLGELESWWEGLRLVVTGADRRPRKPTASPPRAAKVSLDVVPFSQAEQRDTQRWFSEALGAAGHSASGHSATEDVAESAEKPADTLDRTFHLLMSTSIQREALISYRWNVPIVRGAIVQGAGL